MIRTALNVVAFVAVVFGPWWLLAIVTIALCARYSAWEVLIWGLLVDFLYAPFFMPITTILAFLLVWAFYPLRRELMTV